MKLDNYRRIFQAYETPENYYAEDHKGTWAAQGDSLYDKTTHYELKNTVAIALLEGFNKWAKAGLKAFATSDLRHFTLPDTGGGTATYNEHTLSIGGQLSKTAGRTFHYDVTGETWLAGEDAGQLKIDAAADVNFALFGDTVSLAANAYFHRMNPTFYYRHYHARRHWWDNDDMPKETRTRIEGRLTLKKTGTMLRVAAETLKNYTYFGLKYNITDKFLRTGNSIAVIRLEYKDGAWKLSDEDAAAYAGKKLYAQTNIETTCAVQEIDSLVVNVQNNINKMTLKNLYEDGMVELSDPDKLDQKIPSLIPGYEGKTVGDLTINELLNLTLEMISYLSSLPTIP